MFHTSCYKCFILLATDVSYFLLKCFILLATDVSYFLLKCFILLATDVSYFLLQMFHTSCYRCFILLAKMFHTSCYRCFILLAKMFHTSCYRCFILPAVSLSDAERYRHTTKVANLALEELSPDIISEQGAKLTVTSKLWPQSAQQDKLERIFILV